MKRVRTTIEELNKTISIECIRNIRTDLDCVRSLSNKLSLKPHQLYRWLIYNGYEDLLQELISTGKQHASNILKNNRALLYTDAIKTKRSNSIHNTIYKNKELDREKYYRDVICPLIWLGYSCIRMQNENKIDCSAPTAKRLILKYGSEADIKKYIENGIEGKKTAGRNSKGKSKPTKGKTYEEILGPEKAAAKRKQASELWKKNNPRKFFTGNNISKGQLLLFEKVKEMFPNAVLEFPVDAPGKKYYLDIAVPELKLDFEYDGFYWHSFPDAIERDKKRDEYLKSLGWKVFRYSFNARNNLEVKEELNKLNIIIENYEK